MDTRLHEDAAKLSAIDALGANFGVMAIPEKLKEMWLGLLDPYPAAMVNAAVGMVISRYEYKTLPPFAVLKAALDDMTGSSDQALELQAAAEWAVLCREVSRVGSYRIPDLHPTTAWVVGTMGGWDAVCQWPTSSLDFKRRDFIKLWIDSHGRVDVMQLGAGEVQAALAQGHVRGSGPVAIGPAMAALSVGRVTQ